MNSLLSNREDFDLRLVVSSRSNAHGVRRARWAGVQVLSEEKFLVGSKTDWMKLHRELKARKITDIVLAGFMKIVPEEFVALWPGRILNLHPSLLPAYPGLKSIERAFAEKASIGVTVHEVDAGVDTGRILLQRRSSTGGLRELSQVEFQVHVDEQRLLQSAVRRSR